MLARPFHSRPTGLLGPIILVVGLSSAIVRGETWKNWRGVPISVASGRASFEVPARRPGARTLVIVSSLSREPGPRSFRLTASPADRAREPSRAVDPPGPRIAPFSPPIPPVSAPALDLPPVSRSFHLMVRDGDVASASNYVEIEGRLAATGGRVQVYVDARDFATIDQAIVRDVVSTFDDKVYPLLARRFGAASDVDGDGRFTVFFSSRLARLAGGRYSVDGFVRGSDLDVTVQAPFGNRRDMMYLNATLRPGPHLRTVLAHEYMHAVLFSRRVLDAASDRPRPLEEEGWLDEAIAHVAEDLQGFSKSNLDYRISAYLSRPYSYRLVVEDYYAANLFRSHGNRGATYLFLRWCVDRFGIEMFERLVMSNRRGVTNLEAATGRSFASLFREWSLALFLSGIGGDARDDSLEYRSIDLRGECEERVLAGPRTWSVEPVGLSRVWKMEGTSSRFWIVEGSPRGPIRIDVEAPADADLQVTAAALPHDWGGLELLVRSTRGHSGEMSARLGVREPSGVSAKLGAIAWEHAVPPASGRSSEFKSGLLDALGVAKHFGTTRISSGPHLLSMPIRLGELSSLDGPLVIKAVGHDALGRRVAGWVEVSPKPEDFVSGERLDLDGF